MHAFLSATLGLIGLGAVIQAAPGHGQIPSSKATVSVKVINSSVAKGVPPSVFFEPVINGTVFEEVPFFAFLVEHTGKDGKLERVLFDLGIRKDIENSVPDVAATVKQLGVQLSSAADTTEVLTQGGVALSSISTIFWSHWHFDHIGDLSLFPKQVNLAVGPGFKAAFSPGYPENSAASFFSSAVAGRTVQELDFSTSRTQIGSFRALDWFGDGSFYVLDTPGHAIGHISALARTTPGTYILMGGDVCHHAGQLRPSPYTPLPRRIEPSPFRLLSGQCVGEFAYNVHPPSANPRHTPYMQPVSGGFNLDQHEMQHSISIVHQLDANPDVFTIIAHDKSMLGVIDFFPHSANDWKRKGWKDATRWTFLKEFEVS